jgi:hypothetical protein
VPKDLLFADAKGSSVNRVLFHLVAFVTAVLLSGAILVMAQAAALSENALLSAAKSASDKDDLIAVQAIDSKALAVGSDAHRQEDSLILHLNSGVTKAFKDTPECREVDHEAKCQKYVWIAHARTRGVFVVAKLYYESAEYLLVDDGSGEEAVLRQFPKFSPSGKHALVLLINDEQLGFAVQIWRREGRRFVLDWSGSPHAEGMYTSYKLIRWPSENTIELQSESSFDPPKPKLLKKFNLSLTRSGWNAIDVP